MPEHSVGRIEAGAAVAAASAGAAAIHAIVVPEHVEEWWAFGLFFLLIGVAQLVWAVMVVRSPSRSVLWLGVLGNAAIVLLWIVTRTVGTLVGPEPHTPEPVGLADASATAFEVVIVVIGVVLTQSHQLYARPMVARRSMP
jgi:hypothetical protein